VVDNDRVFRTSFVLISSMGLIVFRGTEAEEMMELQKRSDI
jgi:hypothetical protein